MAAARQAAETRQTVAERVTVGLVPKAVTDLDQLQESTGLSKTDLINRAIGLSAFVSDQLAEGKDLLVRNRETGEVEKVHLL